MSREGALIISVTKYYPEVSNLSTQRHPVSPFRLQLPGFFYHNKSQPVIGITLWRVLTKNIKSNQRTLKLVNYNYQTLLAPHAS